MTSSRFMRKALAVLAMTACAHASMATDSKVFPDAERTDFRDETIYFAMTTRFYDGDPTNNVLCWDGQADQIKNNDPCWRGDFKGLIDRLDYLKALGFTAIWITPIVQNCSGFDYHGYHAMDFDNVDLRYESRKDWGAAEDVTFQSLITAAHKKGMKIILDIVLNHTGNFGEAHFAKLFDRDQNIRNQATPAGSLVPDANIFPANYFEQEPGVQFNQRFGYLKNTGGQNLDTHNYWHHYGYGNWDDPTRWWFQIAGDCVDLNTENNQVADYLVKCYGKFIEMGVDGFRIDTTGHIARLTFNTVFIPKFTELGEKYKDRRLNEAPFFMFGECCSRYSGVTYRDQPNLSCYYYTWDSPADLKSQWNHDGSWWDDQVILEGDGNLYGNMALCDKEPSDQPTSNNAVLVNGKWHQPDYSKASNFWPIDFPVHYNFNNVASVMGNIQGGDKYYNDATYNVVYVDSHDYSPGPQDDIRFNGGTAQWAENLSFMFTCRGIPCLYYGSEVEFQKGKTIDKGPLMALKETGRAYFGEYLKGSVEATDFCTYTASGNVEKTLNSDLAQHIMRLNKIRAAVPALRKGQYSFDDCKANGGWAYKRAYKEESYALVAVNGGATFSNVPNGSYTEIVTGKTYDVTGGTVTVDAPKTQGQLRVLVKDWKGESKQVGEHGKFIYDTTPVAHGGSVSFEDPGTTTYWRNEDVIGRPAVTLTPGGSSFSTPTLAITATLNEAAKSGWYQVGTGSKVNLTAGTENKFEIGADMDFGQTVQISWGATDGTTEYTGSATYRKIDPNATITVYVTAPSAPNLYAWDAAKTEFNGAWPGAQLTNSKEINGETYWYFTFPTNNPVNVIFNMNGSGQTADIKDIAADTYFQYDGNGGYKTVEVQETTEPVVTATPAGGNFVDQVKVTLKANKYTTSATYSVNGATPVSFTGTTTVTLGADMAVGQQATLKWTATNGTTTKEGTFTYTKIEKPNGITVYYDNSVTNWGTVNIHIWGLDGATTNWPGVPTTFLRDNVWGYTFPVAGTPEGIIFNNGSGDQTNDIRQGIVDGAIFKGTGNRGFDNNGIWEGHNGVEDITLDNPDAPVEYYTLQGVRVDNPTNAGVYIRRQGNKVTKVLVR